LGDAEAEIKSKTTHVEPLRLAPVGPEFDSPRLHQIYR